MSGYGVPFAAWYIPAGYGFRGPAGGGAYAGYDYGRTAAAGEYGAYAGYGAGYPVYPAYGAEHRLPQPATYKTLQEALELVRKAVEGEREDELFYDYLLSEAPTSEQKEIITRIRNDERKHRRMFQEIYRVLTGHAAVPGGGEAFEKPESYREGIRKALFGELAAMERYRIIRAGMPNRYYRDMVFEILTDEMKHAQLYNYILTQEMGHHPGGQA